MSTISSSSSMPINPSASALKTAALKGAANVETQVRKLSKEEIEKKKREERNKDIAQLSQHARSFSSKTVQEVNTAFTNLSIKTDSTFAPITKSQNQKAQNHTVLNAVQDTRQCISKAMQSMKDTAKFTAAIKAHDEALKGLDKELSHLPENSGLKEALRTERRLQQNLVETFNSAAAFSEVPQLVEELANNTILIRQRARENPLFLADKTAVLLFLQTLIVPNRAESSPVDKQVKSLTEQVDSAADNAEPELPPVVNRAIMPLALMQAARKKQKAAKLKASWMLFEDLQFIRHVRKERKGAGLRYLTELKGRMYKHIRSDLFLNLFDTRMAQSITRFARSEAAKKAICAIEDAKSSTSENLKELAEKIELAFHQDVLNIQAEQMSKIKKEFAKEMEELNRKAKPDADVAKRISSYPVQYLAKLRIGAAQITFSIKQGFFTPLRLNYKAQVAKIEVKLKALTQKIELASGTRKKILQAKFNIARNQRGCVALFADHDRAKKIKISFFTADEQPPKPKADDDGQFKTRLAKIEKEEKEMELNAKEQSAKGQATETAPATEAKTKAVETIANSITVMPPDAKQAGALAVHARRMSGG